MKTNQNPADVIFKMAASHNVFLTAITDLFHWFDGAVENVDIFSAMDAKLAQLDATISADESMPDRLKNEWRAYATSLRKAGEQFFSLPPQSRQTSVPLSIAGGAFQESRGRARNFLVSSVEGQF